MITQLRDILNPDDLQVNIDGGYIRTQTHPEFPELVILNYTEQTQYDHHWNDVTRRCRGLIYNSETGEVLARPFPKIHNFDEAEAPRIVDTQIMYHWDNKWDGSLGIVYRRPDGKIAMATRGSFASEQAIKGTEMLTTLDLLDDCEKQLAIGNTPLYEIIYPDNRIVIDYGDEEFLAPLGSMNIKNGLFSKPAPAEQRTMYDLLMDLSRENSEGWVAWLTPIKAIKIKQADYVELHRIVTGLSKKEVWRQCKAGTIDEFQSRLPDEFYRMVDDWVDELQRDHNVIEETALVYLDEVRENDLPDRKAQALYIMENIPADVRGLVFALLDAKDIHPAIWKMIEPKGVDYDRTTT